MNKTKKKKIDRVNTFTRAETIAFGEPGKERQFFVKIEVSGKTPTLLIAEEGSKNVFLVSGSMVGGDAGAWAFIEKIKEVCSEILNRRPAKKGSGMNASMFSFHPFLRAAYEDLNLEPPPDEDDEDDEE